MARKKSQPTNQLELDEKDKRVAGVAAGIAKYFDTSPTYVRVLAIILVVISGIIPGVIIYLVFWLLMKQTKNDK